MILNQYMQNFVLKNKGIPLAGNTKTYSFIEDLSRLWNEFNKVEQAEIIGDDWEVIDGVDLGLTDKYRLLLLGFILEYMNFEGQIYKQQKEKK